MGEPISEAAKQATKLIFPQQQSYGGRELEAESIIQHAITTTRAADAQRIGELERERDEWRCSAKLYHSELRDLAEGKKVETNLAHPVEQIIRTLRTALADTQSRLKAVTQERDMLADRMEGSLLVFAALNELMEERQRQAAADTERLDWLCANSFSYWIAEPVALVITEYDGGGNLKEFCRQAIDAARASTSGNGPLGEQACEPSDSGPINPTA